MSDTILIVLATMFGTLFGSFASVVISRLRTEEAGILTGTSHCPHCRHRLTARDLVPLLSYVVCQGKCRYCSHPIGRLYPLLELVSWALWGYAMYSALLYNLSIAGTSLLLALTWGWMVIAVYDLKYQEIPDHVSVPMFFVAILFLVLTGGALVSGDAIMTTIYWTIWVYWFFALQILIPGSLYFMRRGEYRHFFQLLWECLTFPILLPAVYFRSIFSKKKSDDTQSALPWEVIWMGEGDLRLALILALTLGSLSAVALAVAYLVGAVVWSGILLLRKDGSHQIAFGPFLMIGWLAALVISPEHVTGLIDMFSTL